MTNDILPGGAVNPISSPGTAFTGIERRRMLARLAYAVRYDEADEVKTIVRVDGTLLQDTELNDTLMADAHFLGMSAMRRFDIDVLQVAVTGGWNINAVIERRPKLFPTNTVLEDAAYRAKNAALVAKALELGADPNGSSPNEGCVLWQAMHQITTAFAHDRRNRYIKIALLLASDPRSVIDPSVEAGTGKADSTKFSTQPLLRQMASVQRRHWLESRAHLTELAQVLIARGADLDGASAPAGSDRTLAAAFKADNADLAEMLIRAGASLDTDVTCMRLTEALSQRGWNAQSHPVRAALAAREIQQAADRPESACAAPAAARLPKARPVVF